MRIRSTKPEFWRSERIASVDWGARLVLKGLESYVDDNGVGKDDLALIVGDVFPRDMARHPRDTLARVSEAISTLHQAGLIHRYEGSGTPLLYVSFWEEIQRIDRPGKGRFPRPDGTFDYKASSIRESVASPPVTLAPGTGEQGNRGTGDISKTSRDQSGSKRARELTDSEFSSQVTRTLAAQAGIDNPAELRRIIHTELGVTVEYDHLAAIVNHCVSKSKQPVGKAVGYAIVCIQNDPDLVRQFIYENGLAA